MGPRVLPRARVVAAPCGLTGGSFGRKDPDLAAVGGLDGFASADGERRKIFLHARLAGQLARRQVALVSHMSRTAAPYPGPVGVPESRLRRICRGRENGRENRPGTAPRYSGHKNFRISFASRPSDPAPAPKVPYEPERSGRVPVPVGDRG